MRYNDKKAKRFGKSRFSTNIFCKALYEEWIGENPHYSHISFEEYSRIWKQVTEQVQDVVVNNPQGIKFPFHCGEMIVQYLPKIIKATDIAAAIEIGDKVNHLNIATKGKVAKISWIRKLAARFNPQIVLFGFEQTRILGQKVNAKLMDTPELFRNSKMKVNDNNK